MNSWLSEIVADCDPTEAKILSDILICAKQSLRKHKMQN